ncbi:MAG: hypothetical protein EOT04_02095 [Candidatus Chaera renei]|uniref:FAD/NAD(P)-binding domain-containing protein n=1 Tax=Candidatus Chaera renei TaxID=2506947 RepID=A0A4V1J7K9_9BACT|nr:MAG: hypothetical protein EOT04_02095 [Candidatus Chaera renei]
MKIKKPIFKSKNRPPIRVVIVGGGFGGIKTALELGRRPEFQITLISKTDYFLYYPSLYSTATGHSVRESQVALSRIFQNRPISLVKDEVTALDAVRKLIHGKNGKTYHYDVLVMAMGSVTTYFGVNGLSRYAYGMKSIKQVRQLKKHLHQELTLDNHLDKNYVVIGAGPSGVELAGSLVGYLDWLKKVHGLKNCRVKISLVESAPRVLPKLSRRASRRALKRLRSLGIHVMLNQRVNEASSDQVIINGRPLKSHTVIWTSGVANHPLYKKYPETFQLNGGGKVAVDEYLRAAPHIYVIGDNAATVYSGLAQTALHDAIFLADHLKRLAASQPLRPYRAVKPPTVVPIGPNWALMEWGWLVMSGRLAALVRRLADFIGYDDVLPIGQALGVWRSSFKREENCPVCLRAIVGARATVNLTRSKTTG